MQPHRNMIRIMSLRNFSRFVTPSSRALSPGLLSLLCAALVSGGCSLGKPASASFASVVIANRSVEQIQQTTKAVLQGDGYSAFPGSGNTLVFEKEGTRGDSLAYNGLVDTHYGAQTIVRFRTDIVDLGGGSLRLQGQAFMVRNANDAFFEDETRLANFRSGPYQKLLDEVAKRLQ
jgi:hypothetical protein